ncbi:MAG: substrate-binding domain-containing protein [Caldilineales bacterium]|nr:substrate-binding domain-containing protein [Caldilineales bacterium]
MRALRLLALWASLALMACGTQVPTPAPEALTVVVADSAAPLARRLAADYAAAYPHVAVRVDVVGNDLAAGARLAARRADLALVTEVEALAVGEALSVTQVARVPLAVVVHPQNPVADLSLDRLRAVFLSQVDNWGQLGGLTRPVLPLVREEGAGSRAAFDAAVLQDQPVTPTALILPGDEHMLAYVADQPGAIGYVPVLWLDGRVRALAVEGVLPNDAQAAALGYPLWLTLSLAAPEDASPAAQALWRWVRGAYAEAGP